MGILLYTVSMKKLRLNENVFNEITPDSAYWIGFLMADGCIWRNTVILEVGEKDKKHIQKFKEFMESEHKISERVIKRENKEFLAYRLSFANDKVVSDLEKHGVVSKKSLTAVALGLENNKDFWRGVIDGDGSLGEDKGKFFIDLYGSLPLLTQYKEYVLNNGFTFKGSILKKKSIYRIKIKNEKTAELVRHFYQGASSYLDRKMETARKSTAFNGAFSESSSKLRH